MVAMSAETRDRLLEIFFSYGNTLPTHRIAHSVYGGLFQPTMTQSIRLLSDPHARSKYISDDISSTSSFPTTDPFSSSELSYSTTGTDTFPAPSAYPSRRHSWIHIFPEGMIHQHPDKVMRYFKWGVARLILEAEPCPDVVPMWIDGPQRVMDHERGWPRPLPRIGKDISVTFGDLVDTERVFEPFRRKWKELKEKAKMKKLEYAPRTNHDREGGGEMIGEVEDDELRYGAEARQLRIDVTMAVRNEVLKVRRSTGLPDEDPKRGLAETYKAEGGDDGAKKEGQKPDGSVIKPGA